MRLARELVCTRPEEGQPTGETGETDETGQDLENVLQNASTDQDFAYEHERNVERQLE